MVYMSVHSEGRNVRIWASDPFKDLESGKIVRPTSKQSLKTCKTMGFIVLLSITSVLVTLLTIYHWVTWKVCFIIYGFVGGLFLFIYK